MKKSDKVFEDVYSLIMEGYVSHTFEFYTTIVTMRSLKKNERLELSEKYKFLPKIYNFNLMIEIVSASLCKICGNKIEFAKTLKYVSKFRPSIIVELYEQYEQLEIRVNSAINKIDEFVKDSYSRNLWNIFQGATYNIEFIHNMNDVQFYWIIINKQTDLIENEKRSWHKFEYMTSYVCAFTNPKAYNKVKGTMSVSKKFDTDNEEFDENGEEKTSEGLVDLGANIANQFKRKEGETKQQYADRVNQVMIDEVSGKKLDDHDLAIINYLKRALKKNLLKKRTEVEIARYFKAKRTEVDEEENLNVTLSKAEIIVGDDETNEKIVNSSKQAGFYHENVSYEDIINDKAFSELKIDVKKLVFDETMNEKIDIEQKALEYQQSLQNKSKDKPLPIKKDIVRDDKGESIKEQDEDIEVGLVDESVFDETEDEYQNVVKAAEKKEINIEARDILEEKKEQQRRIKENAQKIMLKRKMGLKKLQNDNLDSISFE
jgi:hypothetical protein